MNVGTIEWHFPKLVCHNSGTYTCLYMIASSWSYGQPDTTTVHCVMRINSISNSMHFSLWFASYLLLPSCSFVFVQDLTKNDCIHCPDLSSPFCLLQFRCVQGAREWLTLTEATWVGRGVLHHVLTTDSLGEDGDSLHTGWTRSASHCWGK